tara:strand:+ start:63 stop:494 length:432 start_codon:yes stop_codon:yes gene_type:complete
MAQDRKEYLKNWRNNNKEYTKDYDKDYKEKNKEKLAAQGKVWRENNKEKKDAYDKNYKEDNKEKIKEKRDSKKDGLFTVYLLPKENYVGQTVNLHTRLIAHKNRHSRDVSDVQILGKYKTRKKAMEVEAEYHSKGYLGYNKGN